MVTVDEMITDINFLLSELNQESNFSKDITIDTLSDYISCELISIELRQKIVVEILRLFNPNNKYDLQESIFHFLGIAAYHVMRDKIIEFMIGSVSNSPDASMIEYALDLIIDSNSIDKKQVIQACLNSPDLLVRKATLDTLKTYRNSGIYSQLIL